MFSCWVTSVSARMRSVFVAQSVSVRQAVPAWVRVGHVSGKNPTWVIAEAMAARSAWAVLSRFRLAKVVRPRDSVGSFVAWAMAVLRLLRVLAALDSPMY